MAEKARLRARAEADEEMLRPGSAAHLVAVLRKYILDPTSGGERLERCTKISYARLNQTLQP